LILPDEKDNREYWAFHCSIEPARKTDMPLLNGDRLFSKDTEYLNSLEEPDDFARCEERKESFLLF
jgi:hypothetical protein